VWEVLADFGAIAQWVPMIQHSCLLSEQTEGVGTLRRVQIARQTLVERVTVWDPPRELAYTIEGLPPMVGAAHTTWRVTPVHDHDAAARTDVVITTRIDTGRNPAKVLIAKKALERMALAAEMMLAGLTTAAASATDEAPMEEQR
jgi:hypothetical protein